VEPEPLHIFAKVLWKYYGYSLPDPPNLMAAQLINWLSEEGLFVAPASPEKRGSEAISEPARVDATLQPEDLPNPQFSEK
jgi:hypothetical protein